jgi:hypothetical protein
LLANPRTSVTEIALDVGFHGASAFSATFIGSPGKHLPTIAATSNDAGMSARPRKAARRAMARLPLLRSPQARDNGRKHRAATRADHTLEIELFINLKTRKLLGRPDR